MKKKLSKTKKLIISVMAVVLVALACVGVALAVSLYSTAQFKVNTITHTASTNLSSTSGETTLSFTKPGESTTITAETTNETSSVLQCYYTLTVTADTDNEELEKAVLVYFNGEYIGTLAQLKSTDENLGKYVAAATYEGDTAKSTPSVEDTFTFELHNGADGSVYDNKSVSVKITAYTQTADYGKYIYVSNSDELKNAVSEINNGVDSGLLDSGVEIVLLGNVDGGSEELEVTAPCNINLNGYKLQNVTFKLNDTDAYVWCSGSGVTSATTDDNNTTTNGVSVTLTSYDSDTLNDLLIAAAKESLGGGITSGYSAAIFGINGYYAKNTDKITIAMGDSSTTAYAFAKNDSGVADVTTGTIVANTVTRTQVESITVCGTAIDFKILDTATSIVDSYFVNIPNSTTTTNDDGTTTTTYTDISYDIFLPTAIREEGATIEWTSSNPDVMDNTGKIVAGSADKEEVTLTAAITVNGNTTTKSFTFTVSAHTNEVNFYDLIASISPITLYEVSPTTSDTGVYMLPTVAAGTTYDYRESYETPKPSSFSGDDYELYRYSYTAFKDINLKSLTYSIYYKDSSDNLTLEDTGTPYYSYIGLEGNELRLTQNTLEGTARIHVVGEFETGDSYETDILLIIALGNNTTVFDETLTKLNNDFASVNILKNMLETRVNSGVAKEEAYFYVRTGYTATTGEAFTLTYTGNDYIEISEETTEYAFSTEEGEVAAYKVTIDPALFADTEISASIDVTVVWSGGSGTTRKSTFYFTLPAAVHASDFDGDTSLFNSVKAQVIQQLPTTETSEGKGFSDDYSENYTGDYILLRDIVGDTQYNNDNKWYTTNPYEYYDTTVTTNVYTGCTELWLFTSTSTTTSIVYNSTTYTDTYTRDFAALINWATGSGTKAASTVVTNSTMNDTELTLTTTADGKEYLTEDEINVLKTYYMAATGANEATWETVWKTVAEEKAGYVFTGASNISSVVKEQASGTLTKEYPLKYNSILQWATNFRDNEYNPGENYVTGVTVAPEQIKVELALVTYTESATTPSVDDTITISDELTTTLSKTDVSSGTYKRTDTTYTCFYVDTNNRRAWYYTTDYSISSSDTAYKSKYNATGYEVTSWTIGESTTATTAATTTNGNYTLVDWDIHSYLDDDTEYMTLGETQILFAFWLDFDGTVNADRAQAYMEAFYKDATIPTYFMADGVKNLLSSFYTNASSVQIGTADGGTTPTFTAASVATSEMGIVSSIDSLENSHNRELTVSTKVSYAPTVASCEALSEALSYFKNLTQVYVQGTEANPAFLSDYGLTAADSRLRSNSSDTLTTLVMEHVAENYVTYGLSGLKYYTALTQIDVSNNSGISNIAPVINYKSVNYTYIDVSELGLDSEAYKYVVNNRSTATSTLRYGDAAGNNYTILTTTGSGATAVATLSDMEQFLSEYMYTATQVTTSKGTTSDVYWRIDSGNGCTEVKYSDAVESGKEITSADEMQSLISPYYYCTTTGTYCGVSFTANTLYKLTYTANGTFTATALNTTVVSSSDELTTPSTDSIKEATLDKTASTANMSNLGKENAISIDTAANSSSADTTQLTTSTTMTKTFTNDSTEKTYTVTFNCARLYYFKNGHLYSSVGTSNNVEYLSCDKDGNISMSSSQDENSLVCFLSTSGDDITNLQSCLNGSLTSNLTIGTEIEYVKSATNKYDCVLYFPETNYIVNVSDEATIYTENETTISVSSKSVEASDGVVTITLSEQTTNSSGKTYWKYEITNDTSVSVSVSSDSTNYVSVTGATIGTVVSSSKPTYTICYTYNNTNYKAVITLKADKSAFSSQKLCTVTTTTSIGEGVTGVMASSDNLYQYMFNVVTDSSSKSIVNKSGDTLSVTKCNLRWYTATLTNETKGYTSLDNVTYTASGKAIKIGQNSGETASLSITTDEEQNIYFLYYPEETTTATLTINGTDTLKDTDGNAINVATFGVDIVVETTNAYADVTQAWTADSVSLYYWGKDVNSYPAVLARTYSVASAIRAGMLTTTTVKYKLKYWYIAVDDTTKTKVEITGYTISTISDGNTTLTVTTSNGTTTVTDGTTTVTLDSSGNATHTYTYTNTETSNTSSTTDNYNVAEYYAYTWSSITTSSGTDTSYTDDEWTAAKGWTCDSEADYVYISYVPEATETNLKAQKAYIGEYVAYKGETGEVAYHVESATTTTSQTYTNGMAYLMTVSNGSLLWEEAATVAADSSAKGMDSILEEANEHFGDSKYGEYYGMYVAYTGTSNGGYIKGTIYRIMPNYANSKFIYITATTVGTENDDGTTTAYYYCTEGFSYTYETTEGTETTKQLSAGAVYKITFDDEGNVTNIEATSYTDVESGVSEIDHSSTNGYTAGTVKTKEANEETTTTVTASTVNDSDSGLVFNCFVFQNESTSNFMFASSSRTLRNYSASDAKKTANGTNGSTDESWVTYEASKVCFLTSDDLSNINSTYNDALGVESLSDLKCATLTKDASGTYVYDTSSIAAYYLYFPHNQLFAGSSGSSIAASASAARTYYICKYIDEDAGTTQYIFWVADNNNDTTLNESTYVIGGNTSSGGQLTTAVNKVTELSGVYTVDTSVLWNVCANLTKSTDDTAIITDENGLCYYQYTGVASSKTSTSLNGFTAVITYKTGTTKTLSVAKISYTITTTDALTITEYSNDTGYYAYSGGAIYSVKCSYTEYATQQTITITYSYLMTDGTIGTLSNVKSISCVGSSKTLEYDLSNLGNSSGTSYVDNMTMTVVEGYSSVGVVTDGAQLGNNFGMDYGVYYDNSYTLETVMQCIAKDSWDVDGDGKEDFTNETMTNRIVYIVENDISGNSFINTGYYKIVYDESMGSYTVHALQAIDYEYTTYGLGKFYNCRMTSVLIANYSDLGWDSNDKLGTGGTYTVTLCALTHEKITLSSPSGTETGNSVTIGEGNYAINSYTVTDSTTNTETTYYYITVDGTNYQTDAEGNYIYEDVCRYYTVDVVG